MISTKTSPPPDWNPYTNATRSSSQALYGPNSKPTYTHLFHDPIAANKKRPVSILVARCVSVYLVVAYSRYIALSVLKSTDRELQVYLLYGET